MYICVYLTRTCAFTLCVYIGVSYVYVNTQITFPSENNVLNIWMYVHILIHVCTYTCTCWFTCNSACTSLTLSLYTFIRSHVVTRGIFFQFLTDLTFVIGNAALPGFPIIYSSESFTTATDFSKGEVLHRPCTCDFLWGVLTSKETKRRIQLSVDAKTTLQTEVILYKKNS